MKERRGTEFAVTIGTSPSELIGNDPRRHSLWISVPSGNRVTISQKTGIALGQGVTIQNQTMPLKMTYD